MITSTVKIPKSLAEKIDSLIAKGEYSTRADFVLHALRHTMSTYVNKKIEAISTKIPINEKVVRELYKDMTSTFLLGFKEYEGDLVQVNTRIPEGLERKIMLLVKPEYGFNKKADFTRASIICLLSDINNIDSVFEDAEKLVVQQKEMMDVLQKVVMDGFQDGLSSKEILTKAYEQLKNSKNLN